jgi:2-dehydro-3-deoxyphosphogluconate aldolase/(4S)-4-hydroxy-2-oxoglutarate aldolase
MTTTIEIRPQVSHALARSPIVGVVRTPSYDEAARQARALAAAGLELVEITFSVPRASRLVAELLAERARAGGGDAAGAPPFFGMGTVTTAARAREAIAAGAEFFVTPNASAEVADAARQAGLFLIMGALTPTEVVTAAALGADLVKVFPLPPIGGPAYLATIRGPLGDIPMLAAGGFPVEDIPAYRAAGASAFGLAGPLLGTDLSGEDERRRRAERALALAGGRQE